MALERTRALAAAQGVEPCCEQLLALGVLEPSELEAHRREGDDLIERLLDTGALRRDLRLVLDLDPSTGSHAYTALPLTKIVDAEEVERALARRREDGGVLSELLRQAAHDRIAASLRAIGADAGLERLERADDLDPACRELLPRRALEVYRAVPVRREGEALVVALWDPLDAGVVRDLRALVGGPIHPILAEPSALNAALSSLGVEPSEEPPQQERAEDDLSAELADDPFAAILLDALEEGAREVLIEPQGRVASLRFRVRGELRRRRTIPVEAADLLAERLEAIGEAAEEGRLRAGSARLEVSGLPIALDYRVVRTPFGPSLALELETEEGEAHPGLGGLGLSLEELAAFEAALAGEGGLIVLAAPRSQGASPIYRAVLERLARLGREVVSLEDRIRQVVGGTTQLDLGPNARSNRDALLRPVPDWLGLDGSLDPAWLEVLVDAVLAGGGALVTVPAPDAESALLRLRMAGLPSELLDRILRAVVARRLVPRLCARCRFPDPRSAAAWIGLGCSACDRGVAGTVPLAELQLGGKALGPRLRDRLQTLLAQGEISADTCSDLLGPME